MSNTFMEFPPKEYFKSTGNKTYDILKENIDRLEREGLEYAVWGGASSWNYTKQGIEEYTGKPSKEKYIIDNNIQICDGVHVLTPDQFLPHMEEIDTVFICVYVADLVKQQLLDMEFDGLIIPMVYWPYESDYSKILVEDNYDNCKLAFDMMCDDRSKQTIINWMMAGLTGDISLYEEVNGNSRHKLLEQEILKYSSDENFVDIGAFTGDTIDAFCDLTNSKYNSLVAIEPDPSNYIYLEQNTKKYNNIMCILTAVGNYDGTTMFSSNYSESGYVNAKGDLEIPIVRLDSVMAAQNATVIKISSNGYEKTILEGAKELIKNNKPKLSYYCSGNQLWNIPMMLKEIVPEYKFYVRHYGIGMQALIGYAICE